MQEGVEVPLVRHRPERTRIRANSSSNLAAGSKRPQGRIASWASVMVATVEWDRRRPAVKWAGATS